MRMEVTAIRQVVLGAVAAWSMSGCMTWGASTIRPNTALQPVEGKRVGRMLVRLADGTDRELRDVRVGADSLVGSELNAVGTRERVAVARADLREVTLQRFDAGRSLALLAGVAATIGLLMRAVLDDAMSGGT